MYVGTEVCEDRNRQNPWQRQKKRIVHARIKRFCIQRTHEIRCIRGIKAWQETNKYATEAYVNPLLNSCVDRKDGDKCNGRSSIWYAHIYYVFPNDTWACSRKFVEIFAVAIIVLIEEPQNPIKFYIL